MLRLIFSAALILTLVACQSSEERAEGHYQAALALLEEGDLARATVEFRNVFQLNGLHTEARRTFASALREAGDLEQSFAQFLRLAEQIPDDIQTRLALSEMAIEAQAWQQLRLHGPRLLELVPEETRSGEDGTRIEVISITLDYADAIEADDDPARRVAADAALVLLEDLPDSLSLYRVLVDNTLRDGDTVTALDLVNRALGTAPNNRDLHNTKLSLLAADEDVPAVRGQIEEMISLYPDDDELVATLLRFHMSQGDVDAAEAFLRDQLEGAETEEEASDLRSALVQFMLGVRGTEAALDEVNAQIAATGGDMTLSMMQASIRFTAGEREEAVTQMSELIEAGEGTAARINDAKVVLAGMFIEEGNPVGARRLVAEVLDIDGTHETALRLEASWLIEEDRADDAIGLLRRALDEAPGDVAAMTLMARAHARNGNHELARDFLALAYETSNAAPEETLRYAADLISDEFYLAAEEAIISALRLQSGNLQLLEQLGQVYIAMGDWGRAEGVEQAARRAGTPEGIALADGLRLARLTARGRTDDALEFLQDLAADGGGGALAAQVAVVSTMLRDGQVEEALAYLQEALEEDPENIALLMARGATERIQGDLDVAIATYRGIVEAEPQFERAWIELIRTEFATGNTDSAQATLDQALEVLPEGANLLWAQATFLERFGDIDGAIAIYETLYEAMPNSAVVANNLASLISTYRTDDDSLERAYAVARRLRGTDIPAMMDTYGWITFRRGEVEEARPYLERAAEALSDDPLVQFHLGMVLAAEADAEIEGQVEAAIAQLNVALDLAGPEDTRAQFDTARAEVIRLEEALAAAAEAGTGQ